MTSAERTAALPTSRLRRAWPLFALLWLLLLPALFAACRPAVDMADIQTEVNLGKAYLSQVQRTVLRVEVTSRDAAGAPVPGLTISATVLDAAGREVADLACDEEADAPGRYISRPFALGAAALGSWQVNVTTRRGTRSALTAWTFKVDGTVMQAAPTPAQVAAPSATGAPEAVAPQGGTSTAVVKSPVNTTSTALLFGVLVAVATIVGFVGLWRMWRVEDPLADRMKEFGMDGSSAFAEDKAGAESLKRMSPLKRLANGLGLGPRLAEKLAQADLPLTAAEYSLLTIGLVVLGLLLGTWRLGTMLGLVLAAVLGYLPTLYLNMAVGRRRRVFEQQLPDVLMMLVGGLRAGYGLNQALQVVVDQLPAPASKEFGRVVNSVSLGIPITQALEEMTMRVKSDDLGLIVTAIAVQHQVGGNLAETLETIGSTIRDRIRIQGEIRALTAEEQLSGYVLGALPTGLALFLFFVSPEYMRPLFAPGWQRLLPIGAVLLQFMGLWVINKMLVIEV